jgi:hypothetical protein
MEVLSRHAANESSIYELAIYAIFRVDRYNYSPRALEYRFIRCDALLQVQANSPVGLSSLGCSIQSRSWLLACHRAIVKLVFNEQRRLHPSECCQDVS